MNWKRIARLSLLLSLLAVTAAGGPLVVHRLLAEAERRSQMPRPLPATPAETRAMIVAVLESAELDGVPPPPPMPGDAPRAEVRRVVLLGDQSTALCAWQRDPNAAPKLCDSMLRDEIILDQYYDAFAPRKFREELIAANRISHRIPDPQLPMVRLASHEVVSRTLRTEFWQGFYRAYPGTAGYVRISTPVLSIDRLQALVYVEHMCDGLCGSGSLHLLIRTAHGWKSISKVGLWVS